MNFSTFFDMSSISVLFHQTHTQKQQLWNKSVTIVGRVRHSFLSVRPLIYTQNRKTFSSVKYLLSHCRTFKSDCKLCICNITTFSVFKPLWMYIYIKRKHTTCQVWFCHLASLSACKRQSEGLFQPDSAICAALAPAPANQRWTSSLDEQLQHQLWKSRTPSVPAVLLYVRGSLKTIWKSKY